MSERTASVGRSQLLLLSGNGGRLALGLLVAAMLGRHLNDGDLGFLTLLTTVFFLARFLMDLGTGPLAVREIGRDPALEMPLLAGLRRVRGLIGLGFAALLMGFALTQEEGGRRGILLAAAATLPLLREGILTVPFEVRQRPLAPTLLSLLAQGIFVLGVIAAVGLKWGAPVFFALVIVREVLAVGPLPFLARRVLGTLPRAQVPTVMRPFLAMAAIQGAATLLQSLYFHQDVLLVRWLSGEAALGAYSAAFRPLTPILGLAGLVMAPVLPVLAAHAPANRQQFRRVATDSLSVMVGVGALGVASGFTLAEPLLSLLYDGRFLAGPLASVGAFRALTVALFFVFVANAGTTTLIADRGERKLLLLGVVGLAVNLLGNGAFLPRFGFEAAAWVTAATEGVVLVTVLWMLRGRLELAISDLLHVLWPGGVLALFGALVPGTPLVRVFSAAVLGVVLLFFLARCPAALRLRAERPVRADSDVGKRPRAGQNGPGEAGPAT